MINKLPNMIEVFKELFEMPLGAIIVSTDETWGWDKTTLHPPDYG